MPLCRSEAPMRASDGVAANREQRHAAAVHAPAVHDHRLELAGHARLEDALVHRAGMPTPSSMTVNVRMSPSRLLATKMRLACASRALRRARRRRPRAADVVLGLAALGLGDLEATKPSPRFSSTLRKVSPETEETKLRRSSAGAMRVSLPRRGTCGSASRAERGRPDGRPAGASLVTARTSASTSRSRRRGSLG